MERRGFFKTILGAIGAVLLGPKVEEYAAPAWLEQHTEQIKMHFRPRPGEAVFVRARNKKGDYSSWFRADENAGIGIVRVEPAFTEDGLAWGEIWHFNGGSATLPT
jgi:hypothetical protein